MHGDSDLRAPTLFIDDTVVSLRDKTTDDDDEVLEEPEKELEDDIQLAGIREQRYEQLKLEMAKLRNMRDSQHGHYSEMTDEKDIIQASAKEERCIIHFYHRDFVRCKIMDKHLEVLAPKYFSTRFIRVFVGNAPWLVERLVVKVLPCVACFIGGVLKHRLIGFEELGSTDDFTTASLEIKLTLLGVIDNGRVSLGAKAKRQRQRGARGGDSDDYEDSDE